MRWGRWRRRRRDLRVAGGGGTWCAHSWEDWGWALFGEGEAGRWVEPCVMWSVRELSIGVEV